MRIGAIKDYPQLERFVRGFADGKTYIGVGAWGGSPGVGSDNAQVNFSLAVFSLFDADLATELRCAR